MDLGFHDDPGIEAIDTALAWYLQLQRPMKIFGKILSAIFGHKDAAPATTSQEPSAASRPAAANQVSAPSQAPAATAEPVDVTSILDQLAAKNPEKLDWRRSIVDLMKLVGIDSSLTARKELADELGYSGDKSDSAKMNIWLHKQVIRKLSENGGKVPAELLD